MCLMVQYYNGAAGERRGANDYILQVVIACEVCSSKGIRVFLNLLSQQYLEQAVCPLITIQTREVYPYQLVKTKRA